MLQQVTVGRWSLDAYEESVPAETLDELRQLAAELKVSQGTVRKALEADPTVVSACAQIGERREGSDGAMDRVLTEPRPAAVGARSHPPARRRPAGRRRANSSARPPRRRAQGCPTARASPSWRGWS